MAILFPLSLQLTMSDPLRSQNVLQTRLFSRVSQMTPKYVLLSRTRHDSLKGRHIDTTSFIGCSKGEGKKDLCQMLMQPSAS